VYSIGAYQARNERRLGLVLGGGIGGGEESSEVAVEGIQEEVQGQDVIPAYRLAISEASPLSPHEVADWARPLFIAGPLHKGHRILLTTSVTAQSHQQRVVTFP
jgi:hypothetical protein